jgi:transposase, IS30 family
MGRRGPGALPEAEKREHYARLIAQGFNNSEACRIAGVNRTTGKRWRHGRTITTRDGRKLHYAPVVGAGAVRREISPRYLSEDERVQIADLRRAGAGVRAIAERLGRSPSTISRELRRNRDPGGGQYRPFTAHKLAAQRRARPRAGKIARDEVLRQFVRDRLEERWSPQQISQALRAEFPGDAARHVVHETIYQAVYRPELGGLSRELPARVLRTRRRRRRPHRRAGERRPNPITAMTMIGQRPAGAAGRSEPGHWEGDLITGASNRSAIGTLVDRASRFTILLHLPGRHTAEAVRDALIAAMSSLPPQLRRSLTWDQGKEMALHQEVTAALGMPVYFCDKASPWQRPSNENTNGLLRQYFPKGSDLRAHGPGDLAAVAAELNARPRKTLGWDAPAALLGL